MNMLRVFSIVMGILVAYGCNESAVGGAGDRRDCRNDGIGCTAGFACQLNEQDRYECLPAVSEPDSNVTRSDMGMVDATSAPDRGTSETDSAVDATVSADGTVAPDCLDGVLNGTETDVD